MCIHKGEVMIINQSLKNGHWCIEVRFQNFTFKKDNGPFYLACSYNDWNINNPDYLIPSKETEDGHFILEPLIITVPENIDYFECKVYNKAYEGEEREWEEPTENSKLYTGALLTYNEYGKFNVKVEKYV